MAYVGEMSLHPNHPFAHDQISFAQKPEPSSAKPSKVGQGTALPDPEPLMKGARSDYEQRMRELMTDPPSMREIAERKNHRDGLI